MAKYLGETGLIYLWAKIKAYVAAGLGGKQDTIDSSHKLSADLITDGSTNKAYTATEQTKLSGIAAGAEVNVQANWTETSSSSDAYIKNKPTLATVATSGSYNDLSNKPSIPDDSGLVHTTGNETIAGDKTFTGSTRINGVVNGELFLDNDSYSDSKIRLKDDNSEGWVQIVKGSGTSATTLQAALDAKQNTIDSSHKLSADLISDGTTNKAYTATEKTKLSGIATGAEVNQNAFSNVKVGSTTVAADAKTDTLELAAGSNISLTPDATNDKVTIAVTGIADGAEVNQNAFSNIKVGSTTVAADSKTDTVEFVGSGITITPDATNDKITFTAPAGAAPSDATPLVNGTASAGTSALYSRGDHVHPTDTSRVAANAAITGATKTKITYDSKGLVTGGADLSASDIPNLTLSKITDVTATATELNYVDGVTSSIQTQLDGKVASTSVGAANGVCPLDANQKVPAANLPSYVDDVIEAYARAGQTALSSTWLATESASGTVITPEAGKIYVLMAASGDYSENTEFRWGGTTYVKINDGGISEMTTAEMDAATNNWT